MRGAGLRGAGLRRERREKRREERGREEEKRGRLVLAGGVFEGVHDDGGAAF